MENFLLCSTEQEIIIIKTTEKTTVYVVNAIKCNEKTSKQQRLFLIFDVEHKQLRILKHKVSKHTFSTKRDQPKNLLIKNAFISLRDILVGSISGAVGTILTPKLQEFYHILNMFFKLF